MSSIRVQILLERSRLSAGREHRLHGIIRLTAAQQAPRERPPVELVACLDVSGSMEGPKLTAARSSAERLVGELCGSDRLGLVSFATTAEQHAPLTTMDTHGRANMRRAIQTLHVRGNTNMSGGLLSSLDTLRAEAGGNPQALRRVLLFTDGHANAGIDERDREAWTTLLKEQLGDTTVSWFGYGEDHDAAFLAWLADQTRGNAYVATDADAIADAFAKELGGLLGTVAQAIKVRVTGHDGTPVLLNDERSESTKRGLRIDLADLSSEEQRDLVFTFPVAAGDLGQTRRTVELELSWVETRTGRTDSVVLTADVSFVTAAEADAPVLVVREATVLQEAALAMRRAAALADTGDYMKAASVLLETALLVDDVPTERARDIAVLLRRVAAEYGDAGVYNANRSRLTSIRRSMSKQRSSGSEVDSYFETTTQREMRAKFAARPPAPEPAPRKPRR